MVVVLNGSQGWGRGVVVGLDGRGLSGPGATVWDSEKKRCGECGERWRASRALGVVRLDRKAAKRSKKREDEEEGGVLDVVLSLRCESLSWSNPV